MRKSLTIWLLGAVIAATAAPGLAQDSDARRIGESLRDRVTENEDRRDGRRRDREEWRERREEWQRDRWEGRRDDRRDGRWEDRRDRWEDRRDDHRDRWENRRDRWENSWFDRRGYDYRYYGGSDWNRQWTPYGLGYHDGFTRNWVLRNFADRNRNGRVGEREWRSAQRSFYRFADRNYDGYITRFEYDWALREMRRGYGHRW